MSDNEADINSGQYSIPYGNPGDKNYKMVRSNLNMETFMDDFDECAVYPFEWQKYHKLDSQTPVDTTAVTYPADYFIDNESQKPFIYYRKGSISALYHETSTAIHNGNWSDLTVAGYLISYIKTYAKKDFTGKLIKDWISYGITIGKKSN